MKNLIKNIGKRIVTLVGGVTVAGVITYGTIEYLTRNDLSPQDFNKGKWIQVYNEDGKLWDDYMNAKMLHNTTNYSLFLKKTDEKNNGKREGEIWVPVEVKKDLNTKEGEK